MFISWTDFLLSYPPRESLCCSACLLSSFRACQSPVSPGTMSQSPAVPVNLDQAVTLFCLTPSLFLNRLHAPHEPPPPTRHYFFQRLFLHFFKAETFIIPTALEKKNHRKLFAYKTKGKAKQSKTKQTELCSFTYD